MSRNAGVSLSPVESERLTELEDQIGAGMRTFWQVGTALLEIREQRLYRAGHRTFEEYLRVRWNVGSSQGYRLMAASEVVSGLVNNLMDNLSPNGEVDPRLPQSEAQARPLAGLPPEARSAAWAAAVTAADGRQPTAADVEAAAREALARLPPQQQRQVIEQEERQVLGRSRVRQQQCQQQGEAVRLDRALRKLASARKDVAAVAVGVEEALAALDEARAAVERRKDAVA